MKDIKSIKIGDPYNRGSKRKPNYWIAFRFPGHPTQIRLPTGCKRSDDAAAFRDDLQAKVRAGRWTPAMLAKDGPGTTSHRLTFGVFAPTANAQRVTMGVKTAHDDERGHLDNHLIPEFGQDLLPDAATHKRKCEGFANIAQKGLSGSTMRNIEITYQGVMRRAAKAGHILQVPARLSVLEGEIPPVRDTRPEGWRDKAQFTRDEIALLISEHVELQYQVMILTYFLTGGRFAEITRLLVRSWEPEYKPLPALTIRAVKTRRDKNTMYRVLPTHPTHTAWMTWWLREGWEMVHGRAPKPDDLLFPTLSVRSKNAAQRRGIDPLSVPVSHGEFYKRWLRHMLPKAGLAHRRIHDARRTFISILRSCGVDKDLIRKLTHRSVADKVMDAYTTYEWQSVCDAMTSVDWRLPGPPGSKAVVRELRGGRRA